MSETPFYNTNTFTPEFIIILYKLKLNFFFTIIQFIFDISGILQFTNSISARQRWARSHDLRSSIISLVYKALDLIREQDVTAELNNYNIKNSINQLQTFIDTFDVFINPFDVGVPKELLINISSGKAASEPVEQFLLNIEKNG